MRVMPVRLIGKNSEVGNLSDAIKGVTRFKTPLFKPVTQQEKEAIERLKNAK